MAGDDDTSGAPRAVPTARTSTLSPPGPAPRLAIPLGPDPDAPIPQDAIEGVELETCARVAALTSRGVRQRDAVTRLGLDPATYLRAETAWMLRLAAAALRRELSLVEAYDAAFTAARAELDAKG
jgi:hypothetical protein